MLNLVLIMIVGVSTTLGIGMIIENNNKLLITIIFALLSSYCIGHMILMHIIYPLVGR